MARYRSRFNVLCGDKTHTHIQYNPGALPGLMLRKRHVCQLAVTFLSMEASLCHDVDSQMCIKMQGGKQKQTNKKAKTFRKDDTSNLRLLDS